MHKFNINHNYVIDKGQFSERITVTVRSDVVILSLNCVIKETPLKFKRRQIGVNLVIQHDVI